ncbi:MAG TPA: hypothetical protein VMZ74_10015, partial [Ramlibacter sp.]|nr:hypothetical protein [Ramlibacter sp.]
GLLFWLRHRYASPMHDTAIVFLAHFWSEAAALRFERLRRESSAAADCFLLLQDDDPQVLAHWQSRLQEIGAAHALVRFSAATLATQLGLRYFGMRQVMSNTHFPLLQFSHSHRYAYYWQVEYDVEYRGAWGDFFAARRPSEASLIAAHFHNWSEWPEWFWWPSLSTPAGAAVGPQNLYKAFMPVARFSQRALHDIEQAHRQGWMGHYEVIVPTVLLMNGHNLEDLNVRGACYIPGFQDPIPLLPLQSTIRARPPVSLVEFRTRAQGALLFHPVKDAWVFDGKEVKLTR